MHKIIYLNLLIIISYVISYLLFCNNFPYLIYFIGLIVFFLPGLNLSYALEQVFKKTQNSRIILWTFLFSFILIPALYHGYLLFSKFDLSVKNCLTFFIILTLFSFLVFIFTYFLNKFQKISLIFNRFKLKTYLLIFIFFIIYMVLALVIYPYIPEADSYTYLVKIKDMLSGTKEYQTELRPLFLSLSFLANHITKISFYWLYKLIFTLVSGLLLIPFYLFAKKYFKNKLLIIICSVAFLLFPVIALELLMFRPQSVFLISYPIFIFLLSEIISDRKNHFSGLFLILGLSILGMKIHPFFIFAIFISILAIIYYYWPKIKTKPLMVFLILALILFGLYPWFSDFGIISSFKRYSKPFINALSHPKIDLWFIDSYKNIDGYQMGWPGITAIFYYAYNLGLVTPILIVFSIATKFKTKLFSKENWLYLTSFIVFFTIAEIFPRIGLAFYPDRAWLFASLSLAFLIMPVIKNLFQKNILKISGSKINLILILLICFSIIASWAIIYLKQGWISKNEYQVAKYIKENIEADAVIITQSGNKPLIQYFSDRIYVLPQANFFVENDLNTNQKFINNIPEYLTKKRYNEIRLEKIKAVLEKNYNSLFQNTASVEKSREIDAFYTNYQKYNTIRNALKEIEEKKLYRKRPVYVLYSKDKFNNFYGQRAWWKKNNFYNANLEKFDQNPMYKQIYNQNGILIWKVQN